MHTLPEVGFLRLWQIVGQEQVTEEEAARNRSEAAAARARGEKPNTRPKRARPAIPKLWPTGKSEWWAGVRSGRYPQPVKLSNRVTAWKICDIRALIEAVGTGSNTTCQQCGARSLGHELCAECLRWQLAAQHTRVAAALLKGRNDAD